MKRDVLYVDDELDNLVVFEATFEDDFNIVTANSGAEALELLEKQPFPVVVADQRMPGMTGAELFEQIRSRYPLTKRIMLTGYADSQAMLDAINKGQVYYFIKKPWDHDLVFSTIVRALEAHDLAITNLALTDRLVANDRCAALGRSAARIAHEFGNQLCMLPLLELIEDKYSSEQDLQRMALVARKTYDRLTELVHEVKSFVRFRSDSRSRQVVAVSDAVHELMEFLRFDQSLPLDRIVVVINCEVCVHANRVSLQQVLVNLLKNAGDAIAGCEEGRIQLTVDCDGQSAILMVSDNGHGMTAEVAEHIWDTFFTTKGEAGTGLGLDIVKSIVEEHGGQIACRTAPNEGATFTICLPLAEAATWAMIPETGRLVIPALEPALTV